MNQNQKYIIRTDRAGVFFAEIKERNGSEATLTNARRLWYWEGAASLSQLAMQGVTRPNGCKFTVTVPEMTVLGVIEIIPCSPEAVKVIERVAEWKA
jgi:16S rRNA U1498 N3-methylase RsmE